MTNDNFLLIVACLGFLAIGVALLAYLLGYRTRIETNRKYARRRETARTTRAINKIRIEQNRAVKPKRKRRKRTTTRPNPDK
jgi:hypothetical protein